MGFLHEGHQSLIRKSASQNDRTVVSVFVNPIQFGPNEDLEAYPRDLNRDMQKVEEAGGNLIFNPEPSEMYPGHFTSFIDTTETTELLCGAVPGYREAFCARPELPCGDCGLSDCQRG